MGKATQKTYYVVKVRRAFGRDQSAWYERAFATHAEAKGYAQKKMAEPGWRVSGWPRKVVVENAADLQLSYGETQPATLTNQESR